MRRSIALATILIFVLGLILTAAYAAGTCTMSAQGKACSTVSKQGCCPKAAGDVKAACADKCAQNKDCKDCKSCKDCKNCKDCCKDGCKNCQNCKDGCKNCCGAKGTAACCKTDGTAKCSKASGNAACSMNKANRPKQGTTAQTTKKCGSCPKTQQGVKQTVKK